MSLPGLNEPFPSRDKLVTEARYPESEFIRWMEQSLLPRVESAAANVDSIEDSGLTAGVTITPIGADQIAGKYRFSIYLQVVTPAGVSSSLQVTLTWTYNGVVQTEVFGLLNGNLTTTHQGVVYSFDLDDAGPVSYTIAYASNPANAMVYDYSLSLELVKAA
jgi:hypothetical protein